MVDPAGPCGSAAIAEYQINATLIHLVPLSRANPSAAARKSEAYHGTAQFGRDIVCLCLLLACGVSSGCTAADIVLVTTQAPFLCAEYRVVTEALRMTAPAADPAITLDTPQNSCGNAGQYFVSWNPDICPATAAVAGVGRWR